MAGLTVVFLPGIGGSSLSYKGGKKGKTKLWYNPTQFLKLSPFSLALDDDGVAPYPILGREVFPDGIVDLGIYEPLLTQLANDGATVQLYAYDWRQDLNRQAQQFAAWLANNVRGPFAVAAHSMGGLVAQLAYPLYTQGVGLADNWTRTVYLATPHGGSYWAAAWLGGYYLDGPLYVLLANLLGVGLSVGGVAFAVSTALRDSFAVMVSSWPSVYQLLPNSFAPWVYESRGAVALGDPKTYANAPGRVQQQWLANAVQTQKTLAANLKLPRPPELCLLGANQTTLNGYDGKGSVALRESYTTTTDGDGTVTDFSATLPVGQSVQFKQTDHTAICNSRGPLSKLYGYLLSGIVGNAVLPNAPAPPGLFIPGPPPTVPADPFPFVNRHGDP